MSINPSPVLSFRQATINNGEENVIFDVNMKVYPGELVYIIGKVGGGKTSFARTVTAENHINASVISANFIFCIKLADKRQNRSYGFAPSLRSKPFAIYPHQQDIQRKTGH